tara:strand:- start:390 stop:1259 length:870 start_codon:yes stop_codon:yes gene_type:complete
MTRTLILTEKEGWHFQQLKLSLTRKNHLVQSACLSDFSISLNKNKVILKICGEEIPKVDNILVRFIPGGTLEEIVFYLNILKILESMNIRVINDAGSIERTVDKLYTSYLLNQNNINTPKTFVMRGSESSSRFIKNYNFDSLLIYKPLFGSQGDNIRLIRGSDDFNKLDNATNIYYFQEYLENIPNYDYRVLVINNKDDTNVFYMTRHGETFINNVSKGATCTREELDDEIIEMAIRSSRLLNINFCGVDIIRYKDKYYVIEVNSIPAWRGLQEVESKQISDYIINLLQ